MINRPALAGRKIRETMRPLTVISIFWVLAIGTVSAGAYLAYGSPGSSASVALDNGDVAAEEAQAAFQACADTLEIHHSNDFNSCFDAANDRRRAAQQAANGRLLGVVLACLAFYFVPALIALGRKKRNTAAIFALNLFLGWTLIGWVLALVWSLLVDPQPVA